MKIAKILSDASVRALAKRPGLHAVGGVSGLLLQVTPSGAASWVLRATYGGRVRSMGLGPFREVSLKEAREFAAEARALVRQGRDPIEERAAAKRALVAATERNITFEQATRRYFETVKRAELRSEDAKKGWLQRMTLHAFPVLGSKPVSEILRSDVIRVLEPTWPRPSTVALRAQLEAVLEWSSTRGYRDEQVPNPAQWRTLKHVLSKPSRAHTVVHRAACPHASAPAFIAELRASAEDIGVLIVSALELTILTACRSNEARAATWDEFDLNKQLWVIPGARTKTGKEHRVPLCDRAVEILTDLPRAYPNDQRVFACRARNKGSMRTPYDWEISLPAQAIAKQLGLGHVHVHGFRATFKSWAQTLGTRYSDEVSELALGHVNSDATRSCYARDQLLPQRTKLMNEWAQYLEHGPQTAEVINIASARGA